MKRSFLAALVALLPAAAQATPICEALAQEMRAFVDRNPGEAPRLENLAPLANESPRHRLEWEDEAEGRALLKQRFKLDDAAIGELLQAHNWFEAQDLGPGGPLVLWDLQGSMACGYFYFLEARPDGARVIGAPPPQIRHELGELCYTASGWVGEIAGQPVFAVERRDNFTPAHHISVAAWNGEGWAAACEVDAQFEPAFEVIETHFAHEPMAGLADIATEIAGIRYHSGESPQFSYGDSDADARRKAMANVAGEATAYLPSFDGEQHAFHAFDEEAPHFPLVVDGKAYLARIGHGILGWRTSSNYLLGLWDLDSAKPVAGVVVATKPGALEELKISRVLYLKPPEP